MRAVSCHRTWPQAWDWAEFGGRHSARCRLDLIPVFRGHEIGELQGGRKASERFSQIAGHHGQGKSIRRVTPWVIRPARTTSSCSVATALCRVHVSTPTARLRFEPRPNPLSINMTECEDCLSPNGAGLDNRVLARDGHVDRFLASSEGGKFLVRCRERQIARLSNADLAASRILCQASGCVPHTA